MKFSKQHIAALAFAALGSSAAVAQEVALRLQQCLPQQATIPAKAIVPWIKEIEAESNGRIKIQMFSSMQMRGTPPQLFDRARDGVADIAWTVLGATPVGMPVPGVTDAQSKGVLDGTTIPWEVGPSLKVQELVKHHTTFAGGNGLYVITFALSMNKAAYNKLPADLKKVIDSNSGIETAALLGRAMDDGDKVGREFAVKAGNKITEPEVTEMQHWRRTASTVETDWVNEVKGIDGVKRASEARALIAKYNM